MCESRLVVLAQQYRQQKNERKKVYILFRSCGWLISKQDEMKENHAQYNLVKLVFSGVETSKTKQNSIGNTAGAQVRFKCTTYFFSYSRTVYYQNHTVYGELHTVSNAFK